MNNAPRNPNAEMPPEASARNTWKLSQISPARSGCIRNRRGDAPEKYDPAAMAFFTGSQY
jgi:hypothetical protein